MWLVIDESLPSFRTPQRSKRLYQVLTLNEVEADYSSLVSETSDILGVDEEIAE